jgi:hypothetical protein
MSRPLIAITTFNKLAMTELLGVKGNYKNSGKDDK